MRFKKMLCTALICMIAVFAVMAFSGCQGTPAEEASSGSDTLPQSTDEPSQTKEPGYTAQITTEPLTDADSEAEEIQTIVVNFLGNYTVETMLYQDTDLTSNTVADPSLALAEDALKQAFELSSGTATVEEMQNNILFVGEKAKYYKGFRQAGDIYRTDLELNYRFQTIDVSENTAHAIVSEVATFTYTDSEESSVAETVYEIDLVKISEKWLIADVTDNDWFDAEYKDTGDFNAEEALKELEETEENNEA